MTRYQMTLVLALTLTAMTTTPVDAQTPQTFRACFVPQVGAMYLLDLPGLPTACLSEGHEEITWSEGGPLPDASVTSAKIAADAVDGTHIADGAITLEDLAPGTIGGAGSVGPGQIAENSITSGQIVNGQVTNLDIANNSVTGAKIASNTITGADILRGAIGAEQIGTNAVDSEEIAPDAIGASEIAADAVGSSEIAAGAVGSSEIAANAVTSREIGNSEVGASEIANSAVGSSEIAPNAVGSSEIARDAVGSDEIASNSVGPSELAVAFTRRSRTVLVPALIPSAESITCLGGQEVFSGTWSSSIYVQALRSFPTSNSQWSFTFFNPTPNAVTVTLYAVCADVG